MKRCEWVGQDPLYIDYHDNEWGTPTHDDKILFEFLVLESAQAGLSWITILKKRENYREAMDEFDYIKIAEYGEEKVEELLNNPGIIRNRLKIRSAISNAQNFIKIQKEFGSFDKYIWGFTNGEVVVGNWQRLSELPVTTELSDKITKDLKKRGFKFIGSTIIYSYLQAIGIVNDHTVDCFKY